MSRLLFTNMDERRRRKEPTKLGSLISAAGARIADLFFKKQLKRMAKKLMTTTDRDAQSVTAVQYKAQAYEPWVILNSPTAPAPIPLKRTNSAPD